MFRERAFAYFLLATSLTACSYQADADSGRVDVDAAVAGASGAEGDPGLDGADNGPAGALGGMGGAPIAGSATGGAPAVHGGEGGEEPSTAGSSSVAGGTMGEGGHSAGAAGGGTDDGGRGNGGGTGGGGGFGGAGVSAGAGGTDLGGGGAAEGIGGEGGTAETPICLFELCGNVCTDTRYDPKNCDVCGRECGPNQVCSNGSCEPFCLGSTQCDSVCVDDRFDPLNCGGCGIRCASGEVCSNRACLPWCLGARQCGEVCVDDRFDPLNCGGCESQCALGEVCAGGVCDVVCGPGTELCDDRCADTRFDHGHCGDCRTTCDQNEVCSDGVCEPRCLETTQCGGACVDERFDPRNCGGCGIECAVDEVCSEARCTIECAGGAELCGDRCADTRFDPRHCGECGVGCDEGDVCSNSVCAPWCLGSTQCGDDCVDTQTDPDNCGGCEHACELPQAGAACVAGQCRVVDCVDGYFDVDRKSDNGCECRTGAEVCDGIDNDCNGQIDFKTVNDRAESVCFCGATLFDPTRSAVFPGPNSCSEPSCEHPGDGSVVLSACQNCQDPWPWTTCVFAENRDLTVFDASYQDQGWMEVTFCTEGLQFASTYLWYGTDPKRRKLQLSRIGDGDRCATVYFPPEAACFADFAGMVPECMNVCGRTDQSCAPFDRVQLSLTIEGCDPGHQIEGRITLKSVTFLDNACRCTDSSSCNTSDRPECRDTGLPDTRVCTP